jgi:hypothetical protein
MKQTKKISKKNRKTRKGGSVSPKKSVPSNIELPKLIPIKISERIESLSKEELSNEYDSLNKNMDERTEQEQKFRMECYNQIESTESSKEKKAITEIKDMVKSVVELLNKVILHKLEFMDEERNLDEHQDMDEKTKQRYVKYIRKQIKIVDSFVPKINKKLEDGSWKDYEFKLYLKKMLEHSDKILNDVSEKIVENKAYPSIMSRFSIV